MYVRDKSSHRLPPGILLLLSLIMLGLTLHFIAEDLASVCGIPGMGPLSQAGIVNGIHEHSEDNFVFPALRRVQNNLSIYKTMSQEMSGTVSISLPPQPPPPINQVQHG